MPPEIGPGAQPPTPPVDPANPPVATPPAGPAPAPATPPAPAPAPAPETFDRAYVEQLRRENADWRTKHKTASDELDALKRTQMSKEQQLEADVKKLRDELVPGLTRENQQLKVQVTASKLGIVDPEAASLLLDWSAIDAGTAVDDALAALVVQRPWLKAQTAQPPAAPTPPTVTAPPSQSSPATPPASTQPASFTKSQIDKMTPAELERRMAEIDQAIAEKRVDFSR